MSEPTKNSGTAALDLQCPTMRLMVLTHLIQQFEELDPSSSVDFRPAGFDMSTIRRILSFSTSDLVRLAKISRTSSIQIKVNTTNLVSDMNRYEHMRADNDAFDYFVRHGAPANLIMSLFAKSAADIKRAQFLQGVEPATGRPTMPTDDIRMEIWARWEKLRTGMNGPEMLREHYMQLHKEFHAFSIATLCAVIKTFMQEVRFSSPEQRRAFTF